MKTRLQTPHTVGPLTLYKEGNRGGVAIGGVKLENANVSLELPDGEIIISSRGRRVDASFRQRSGEKLCFQYRWRNWYRVTGRWRRLAQAPSSRVITPFLVKPKRRGWVTKLFRILTLTLLTIGLWEAEKRYHITKHLNDSQQVKQHSERLRQKFEQLIQQFAGRN